MTQPKVTADQVNAGTAGDQIAVFSKDGVLPGSSPGENLIINGDFRIWQREETFTSPGNLNYTADRWQWNIVGGGAVDVYRPSPITGSPEVPNIDPSRPFLDYIEIDVTTADASLGATEFYLLNQRIEGLNIQHLNFGTVNALSVTLSFWHAHTKTGTHCISLRNSVSGTPTRSYVVEYTQDVTNVWEKETITIPGETTGVWMLDNTIGMSCVFTLATGSSFEGTGNQWNNANDIATTNQVNNMDTIGNKFRIGNVKLEVGEVATPFLNRSFTDELALCQRYYEKSYRQKTFPGTVTITNQAVSFDPGVGSTIHAENRFKVVKRTNPTLTIYSSDSGTAARVYKQFDTSSGDKVVTSAFASDSSIYAINVSGGPFNYDNAWFYQYEADAEL